MITKYYNLHLIDGTGTPMQENAELYVKDGRICEACEFDNEVDLDGKYVIPGMMNGHLHLSGPPFATNNINFSQFVVTDFVVNGVKNLEELLKQGVTFVRDVGSIYKEPVELAFRKHLASGFMKGPNMICSGPMMAITGGHGAATGSAICDGVEECRKMARKHIAMGVDLLKMAVTGGVGTEGNDPNAYQFNVEEIAAVVHEAHKVGKRVAVHGHGTQGIKNALIAGVDSIEHGTLVDDESVDMMVERGVFLVPTLAVSNFIMTNPQVPAALKAKEANLAHLQKDCLRNAYNKGVKLGIGTDLSALRLPYLTQIEMILIMKAVETDVIEAIQIATKNTSEMLGIDANYGTLETGKIADFVVLGGNPCEDEENLKNIAKVYQKGCLVVDGGKFTS